MSMTGAVAGPTASGKSALALALAERVGGEIVSVDSMQLYRGLDLGCAKPTAAEQQRVPHHLLDVYDLSEKGDIYRFLTLADAARLDIERRGRIPILCGGTGFYLKALLRGLDELPGDETLRRQLETEYARPEDLPRLRARLAELDPGGLARAGNCRRRLLRLLEVRLLTGHSLLTLQQGPRALRFPVRVWLLDWPPEQLRRRIAERTRRMLAAGWIEEARTAIAAGLLTTPTAHQALGYRLIGDFLAGKFSRPELEERIITATAQFARRQRTWFRHQHPEAVVLPMAELNFRTVVRELADQLLRDQDSAGA